VNRLSYAWILQGLLCACIGILPARAGQLITHRTSATLMGVGFEFIAVTPDAVLAEEAMGAAVGEIERIKRLISSWDPNSQTSTINAFAGIKPVVVDSELFELIRRTKKISRLTSGIFDISYASIDEIWKFDGSMIRLPSKEEMAPMA
tara:strand:- start:1520 stop:1963 length:444 start_codon:yes stop_codon:yes gene_type:complete